MADPTEEELEAQRKADEEAQAKAQAEQEAAAKLRAAEDGKIKAEAELEAFKKIQAAASTAQNQGSQQWTEEQWSQFEAQYGVSRQQAQVMMGLSQQAVQAAERTWGEKISKAEERAKKAEDRMTEFESRNHTDLVKQDYLRDRPALKRYEADVEEFLAQFPKTEDKAELKKRLGMAETYVKGKVGEKNMRTNGEQGGPRFNRGNDLNAPEDFADVDLRGLKDSERQTVSKILPTKEKEEVLRKHDLHGDGRAIGISGEQEWADAQPKFVR